MSESLARATVVEDFTGRTLEGRAYRYDSPSRVTDDGWKTSYYEEMSKGADNKSLKERSTFPLRFIHSAQKDIGTVEFMHSDDERALMFRAVVDHGPEGDALLEEIDQYRDVSVGFKPIKTSLRRSPYMGDIVSRREIRLDELSLAPTGAGLVKGAEIEVVRASIEEIGTPRLDALKRKMTVFL